MSATLHTPRSTPLQIARDLAQTFSRSVVERDRKGGTPKAERDALRASGLLALSIPREFGGLNATWSQTFDVVREFARVDSSIAHVFGFHHLMLATVRLFGAPSQWQPWYELTARKNWFWGNALNPLDTRTIVKHHGSWREFSGKKSFCSGASDSQMLIASAVDEAAGGKLLIAAIPSGRTGITLHDDWHNMGQRQTDSGSATFERVRVEEGDLLLDPGPLSTPFACLRPLIAQLHFANICLGIAEGAFEEANGGTLFLDEIGDLPMPIQVKLLRVLQEREVVRLGSRKSIPIDVRVLAATNVQLEKAINAGHFREDLYYRLDVVSLELVPLRERPGDILPLTRHFIDAYSQRLGYGQVRLSAQAEHKLRTYGWPGNIRELENVIHHTLLICRDGLIEHDDLRLSNMRIERQDDSPSQDDSAQALLERAFQKLFEEQAGALHEQVEDALLRAAYRFSHYNQVHTANLLGLTRNVTRTRLIKIGELAVNRRRPTGATQGERVLNLSI